MARLSFFKLNHTESIMRQFRILTFIIPVLALAGCGQGDGPDSIPGTAATPLPPIPPGFCDNINFEVLCPPVTIINFNGGATTIIDNPDMSGINTSDSVAQMQKFADEVFGGTRFDLPVGVDFSQGEAYTVKVWSPRSVEVSFKLEETGNPAGGRTLGQDHTGSGAWEELCFDFTGQTASIPNPPVQALTIIFDLGTLGQAATDPMNWTFYYDDITQVANCPGGGPGPGPASFPITFDEATPPAVTEFGGAGFAIEPGPAGGDGTALKIVRDGGDVFAGAWVAIPEVPNDQGVQTVSADVYSPTGGIPMVAKVEFGDNMGTGEVQANETVVVGWQTLTWTFTNLAPPDVYNRFTILPNLGTVDTATDYFFDNIDLVSAGGGGNEPTAAAPTPTQDPANVISLFSDAYTDVVVDTFLAGFSAATLEDVSVAGDAVKKYSSLDFAGIEFLGANAIDASGMTHVHLDIWTPDATDFSFKFVDFGGDGFGGGNDTENVPVSFNAGSTPPLTQGNWISIDVSLLDLQAAGLTNLTDLNQLIIVGQPPGGATVFVDNLYFYNDSGGGGGSEPTVAAPTPMRDPGDVISLFSNAYGDVSVDTFLAGFSAATLEDVLVDGNDTKKYSSLDFAGIEFVGANAIDASGMTHIHLDIWSPDATDFAFKFVDFGGDGFGGGNDSENALVSFNAGSTPPLTQGNWISLDVALADLQAAGLTNLTDLNQLIIVGQPPGGATVFVDNIYFYDDGSGGGGATAPTMGATAPTQDPANVMSLYSDAYTDAAVTWPTTWSVPNDTTSDVMIDGQLAKEHLNVSFIGVEFPGMDVSGMTHLHVDVWTPDVDSLLVRLVDFGGDGFGGGNDTQGDVTFDAGSTPPLTQSTWVSLDIPLADFQAAGLTNLTDINQLVFDPTPDGTILYIDNVYFYDDGSGGGGNEPTMAAPTPTQDPANVISLFSDAYTDVTVDTFLAGFSAAGLEDVTVAGNATKKYTSLDFAGIEFVGANAIDASGMTHIHLDIWSPDATDFAFKFVDFGGDGFGGGNDSENALVSFNAGSTPPLTQGNWISLDVALADLQAAGLTNLTDLNQLIIVGQPPGGATIFVDNIYFYDDGGGGGGTAPTVGAPAPMQAQADVMSLYSDAYTDAAVTWPTPWSVPNDMVSDVTIDGGLVKEHLNTSFIGVEFPSMDVSGMTHFHMDVWTPDATSLLVKLVDFGGDGFGGGNDSEGPLTFDAGSTPTLVQGTWVSLDIPLADMQAAGLTNLTDINQLVFDPAPDGTAVYVDNVYFYNDAGGGGGTVLASFDEAMPPAVTAFGGAVTAIEVGPAGGDGSNALRITRDGGDVFAGAWIAVSEIPNDAGNQTVSALVYSPTAGIPMVAKAEYGDNMGTGDVQANETVVVGWQTLTWTFTNIAAPNVYNRFTILPNLGTVDTATNYYFDNITLEGSGGGGGGGTFVNGDFETGDFTGWTLTQVPTDRGSIALDTSGQGGRAGTVARLVAAGDAAGTNDVLISQVALAAGTVAPGDSIDVSFDLYGSLTGAGGVVFVEVIFLNGAGQDEGGRNFVGPAAPYVPTTTWTTYSGTVIAGTAWQRQSMGCEWWCNAATESRLWSYCRWLWCRCLL